VFFPEEKNKKKTYCSIVCYYLVELDFVDSLVLFCYCLQAAFFTQKIKKQHKPMSMV